jgi:glycosyltransferase involved in cell wall biosynthesis
MTKSFALNSSKTRIISAAEFTPLVAILLCTFNGERFLSTQLESLNSQTHENWYVVASDDGSTDQTLKILQDYQARWPQGKLIIRSGPKKGFCQNFLSLACDPSIVADFYAFCDQDDVWLPAKLLLALIEINKNKEVDQPYLYCGRTEYVDENLITIGFSPLFSQPRTFRNALIQSIAGGNTMVFNVKTKKYLEKTGPVNHPSHDWWLYQLVTGVGGFVFYDPEPKVLYRQHDKSLVGSNNSLFAKLKRISMVLQGEFYKWSEMNIAALSKAEQFLIPENLETLEIFKRNRCGSLNQRLGMFKMAGLYRQTRLGTISMVFTACIKRL